MMNHTSLREVGYSNITEHVWYVVCVSVCVCVCVCVLYGVCVCGWENESGWNRFQLLSISNYSQCV